MVLKILDPTMKSFWRRKNSEKCGFLHFGEKKQ